MQNNIDFTNMNEVYNRSVYLLEFIKTMKMNGDIIKKDYKKNKKSLLKIMNKCTHEQIMPFYICKDVFYISKKMNKIYENIKVNMNNSYTFKKL